MAGNNPGSSSHDAVTSTSSSHHATSQAQAPSQAYFSSYSDLSVHELMLNDRPRTLAYRKFFENNRDAVRDKVVMDVGAGSGILSLFAASAGAKKVYAVEASDMATICEEVVNDNSLGHIIEVLHCAVEVVTLPPGVKVDLIVSEWMGFYLLHEAMLDSVLFARDKFLAPDGILAPSHAAIYMAPVDMTNHFQDRAEVWSNVYGFDFSPIASAINVKEVSEPLIKTVPANILRADPQEVLSFDLKTVTVEEVRRFSCCLKFKMNQESLVHGFAVWFDTDFKGFSRSPNSEDGRQIKGSGDSWNSETLSMEVLPDSSSLKTDSEGASKNITELKDKIETVCESDSCVTLGTGPRDPPTHWKQTVIFLPQTCLVEKDIDLYCKTWFAQSSENKRHYNITLELTDVDEEMNNDVDDNDDECVSGDDSDDSSARNQLIAALTAKYNSEHDQLENEAEMVEKDAKKTAAEQINAEIEEGGWEEEGDSSVTECDSKS